MRKSKGKTSYFLHVKKIYGNSGLPKNCNSLQTVHKCICTYIRKYTHTYIHKHMHTGLYTFNAGPCVSIQLPARLTVAGVVPGPQS